MIDICGPRGSGRTTALVNWCNEDPDDRILVVRSTRELHFIASTFECQFAIKTAEPPLFIAPGKSLGIDNWDYFHPFDQQRLYAFDLGAITYESLNKKNLNWGRLSLDDIASGVKRMMADSAPCEILQGHGIS